MALHKHMRPTLTPIRCKVVYPFSGDAHILTHECLLLFLELTKYVSILIGSKLELYSSDTLISSSLELRLVIK